jgi:hypothetical protein
MDDRSIGRRGEEAREDKMRSVDWDAVEYYNLNYDKAKASESYDTVASLSSAEAGKAYEALVEDVVKEVGEVVSNDIIRIISSSIIVPVSAVV